MIEIGERAAWMALMVRITTVCNGTRAREACEGSEPGGAEGPKPFRNKPAWKSLEPWCNRRRDDWDGWFLKSLGPSARRRAYFAPQRGLR